jgi:hypothetical protein
MNLTDKIALLKKLHGECAETICGPHTVKLTVQHKPTIDFIFTAHNHLPEILEEMEFMQNRIDGMTSVDDHRRALTAEKEAFELGVHLESKQAEIERLRADNQRYVKALGQIMGSAGHPDAAEGCRIIIGIAKAALGES